MLTLAETDAIGNLVLFVHIYPVNQEVKSTDKIVTKIETKM